MKEKNEQKCLKSIEIKQLNLVKSSNEKESLNL